MHDVRRYENKLEKNRRDQTGQLFSPNLPAPALSKTQSKSQRGTRSRKSLEPRTIHTEWRHPQFYYQRALMWVALFPKSALCSLIASSIG